MASAPAVPVIGAVNLAAAPNVDPQLNPFFAANSPAAEPNATDSVAGVEQAPIRIWRNDAGETVATGEFVGVLDGGAVIRKTGGGITVIPFAQVSSADRKYVAETFGKTIARPATLAQD